MKRNTMIKKLCVVLTLTAFITVGCTDTEVESQVDVDETIEEEDVVSTFEYITIGYAKGPAQDITQYNIGSHLQQKCEEKGSGYIATEANGDLGLHISQIEDMLEGELQYLIIEPIQEIGYEGVLDRARDAGVVVIGINNPMSGSYATYLHGENGKVVDYGEEIIDVIDQLNKNEAVGEEVVVEAEDNE